MFSVPLASSLGPTAFVVSCFDPVEFERQVSAYYAAGWNLGNLSTAAASWPGPNPDSPRIYFSMVVTNMSYIPPTSNQNVTLISAAYTIAPLDQYIEMSTSGTSYAVTLPAATGSGRPLTFKKITSGQTITITAAGSDKIDGAATLAMKQLNLAYSLIDAAPGVWDIV